MVPAARPGWAGRPACQVRHHWQREYQSARGEGSLSGREGGRAGVGSSIDTTRVVSESDPPKKNHRTRDALLLKNTLKHFKHCPDQIRDHIDDNAEEPRTIPSLQQNSEFRQILRILLH
jgi:hypothetical protein